ncbi:transporter substrate-binding domain-containing protein [Wukongibacter baidiensis]|uniref:transporter substrate-binding domain-containing protein n=1 Tax=Wukongibacter baidiensis TaxID=1723361 RepID=UPI003D7F9863
MKKRIFYVSFFFLIISIIFINEYLTVEYNINLYEFFRNSTRLTLEERIWLKEHGDIVYGADNNSPPLRYVDTGNEQYRGVVIDYLSALSIELGTDIKVKPMVWDEALKSLARGETDICDMYPSEERSKVYLFSDPIYYQRGVILVPKDYKAIKNYRDLRNKRVAAQKGDYVLEFLNSNVTDVDYTFTADYLEALSLLRAGEVDAVVGDEPVISYFIEALDIKEDFVILEDPLYEKESVLSVPKSEKILLNIINKGIYNLNKKNTMSKIQQKWFGISTPITKSNSNEKMSLIIAFFSMNIMIASYLFYTWNKELKREVDKRTEELYVSRNDLQTTFDGLTHLMIVLNKDCTISSVNQSFCEVMGIEKENVIGKNCFKYFRMLDNECLIRKTFVTKTQHQKEIEYQNKLYEVTSFPLEDKQGIVNRVLVMMKDVTQVRVSEQQILHSNKMAAVGQLAAGVAHEIRNPLGVIRNSSYLLKKNMNSNPEIANKSIEMIEKSVERASNIIDNLLNFSRLSSTNLSEVNMLQFIKGIVELNKKAMMKQSIVENVMCDPFLKCRVNVEALKHILINLISNAIDVMPNGGTLTIECSADDKNISISCTDTGYGIDEKNFDKIFNPFYTTKEPGKGTGLGLFIAYDEVQKMGGNIGVTSALGYGTTFTVNLPLKEDEKNDR